MTRIHVEAERVIDASPKNVYAILADYQGRHQRILPPETFKDFHIEEGGQGEGTVARFRVAAGGRERPYRMRVTEPDRGRKLVEEDTMSSLVTTFTVEPVSGGQASRVRIATEWQGGRGIGGIFERTFAPGTMRRIYEEELDRLVEETRD